MSLGKIKFVVRLMSKKVKVQIGYLYRQFILSIRKWFFVLFRKAHVRDFL